MDPSLHLIIHNIGMSISGIVALFLAAFVLINNPRRIANIMFALTMLASATFIFSHIAGVSVADSHLSRQILTLNVSVIFIGIFNTHLILAVLGKERERRLILWLIYLSGIGMTLLFILFPSTFLELSVPKMYFPNYYEPGTWHWLFRLIFNVLVPIYFASELALAYVKSENKIDKNRYLYFAAAEVLGWGVGFTPIYLVYDLEIDPAFGSPFVFLYALPFLYALVQYELMDIRVVAKKAFWYALAIFGIGGFILLINMSNRWVEGLYPNFPFFIAPLVSATVVLLAGLAVWKKLREADLLKYEFITVATHKFRTPLTRINWAADNLLHAGLTKEQLDQIEHIKSDDAKLVELTNLLVQVSESEDEAYNYKYQVGDLGLVVKEVLEGERDEAKTKNLNIVEQIGQGILASYDEARLKFVIRMIIENAIRYTPQNGTVIVSVHTSEGDALCSVHDTGIGMSKEDTNLIFSKFYRGRDAKLADTEGMGVGLFISREIINRHGGKIWAESAGVGKGSTFTFSLPLTN